MEKGSMKRGPTMTDFILIVTAALAAVVLMMAGMTKLVNIWTGL